MNAGETTKTTEAAEEPVSPKRNRWTNFSLLTILLLLTIAALGISHFRMMWRLDANNEAMAAMEAELIKLRKEAGYLEIQDETLVHVVAAPTHEDLVWRWKVFVPKDVVMKSHSRVARSSGSSMTSASQLKAGENQVELAIYRGPEGEWKKKITTISGPSTSSSSTKLPEEFMSWMGNSTTSTSGLLRAEGTKTYQPDEAITLLKMTARGRTNPDPKTGEPGKKSEESTEISAWLSPEDKS